MDQVNKQKIILVDPQTKEIFNVLVNAENIEKIKNDPNYQKKMLNDIKKSRNDTNRSNLGKANNLVELQLTDTYDKIHSLMVPVAKRDRALRDIVYASELLHEHLSALPTSSNAGQADNTESGALEDGVSNVEKDPVFELTLIEPSTMEKFVLFVDQETFNHAQNDISFATQLLDNHKAALDQQKSNCVSTIMEANNASAEVVQNNSDELENLIRMYENDDVNDDESSSKQTGRYSWSDAETLLLIKLYKDNDAAFNEGKMTYKNFWKRITDGMVSKGYNITTSRCTSKMDSLKRMYKNVKDHNAQSGNDKKTCNFYEELDELFSKKPWIKPLSVAGSNLPLGTVDINKTPSNLKRPKSALEALKASYLEQSLEMKRLKREDTENYREKKLAVMKDLVGFLRK